MEYWTLKLFEVKAAVLSFWIVEDNNIQSELSCSLAISNLTVAIYNEIAQYKMSALMKRNGNVTKDK